jgi:hypothetical protein
LSGVSTGGISGVNTFTTLSGTSTLNGTGGLGPTTGTQQFGTFSSQLFNPVSPVTIR